MPKKRKVTKADGGHETTDKTIYDYYNSRLTMATGPPNYKIILCGEYGVGKSALFRRFMNDTFTEEMGRKSTIGLDQASQSFNVHGQEVKVGYRGNRDIQPCIRITCQYNILPSVSAL